MEPQPATGPIDPRRWTVVCKHWLKGLCMKDDKCDYLHQYDLSRMPVCPSSTKGRPCTNEDCVFKHMDPNDKQVCPRYALGYCHKGNRCQFKHERGTVPPDYLPDWYFCEVINSGLHSQLPMKTDHLFAEGDQPPLPGMARYFLVRCDKYNKLQIAFQHHVWATAQSNYKSLIEAFRQCEHVIMIFLVEELNQFLGYARLMTPPDPSLKPGIFGPDPTLSRGDNFRIRWHKIGKLDLEETNHLRNPYDGMVRVRMGKDCQEIEPSVAVKLCSLISKQPDLEILPKKRRRRSSS